METPQLQKQEIQVAALHLRAGTNPKSLFDSRAKKQYTGHNAMA